MLKRRKTIALPFATIITTMVSICLLPPALTAGQTQSAKPNIIIVLTDDQGYADLGVQGSVSDIRTPHIDRLAASGVRCSAGYITAPQCSPSRAGLITGRYQARFGVEEIALCPLPLEEVTIAERLQEAGYRTGFVGKWHLDVNPLCADWLQKNVANVQPAKVGRGFFVPPELAETFSPHAQGFDDFYDGNLKRFRVNFTLDGNALAAPRTIEDDRFRIDVQSDAAVAFIEKNKSTNFFLHLCYFAPHVPLEATEEYLKRFPDPMPARRRYGLAMISAIDDGVGRIMAKLKEHSLDQNTLIFFTSDNGAPLKGKRDLPISNPGGAWDGSLNDPLSGEKGTLLEGGIRVPFVVNWPNGLPGGRVYDRPVSSLDFAATALAVAGQPQEKALDGVSLLPYLRGELETDPHDQLFWRFWGQTAVRSGDWKLLRLAGGETEMLYDLAGDTDESTNLIDEHPEIASRLRQSLTRWESQMAPAKPRGGLNAQEQEWFREKR